MAATMADVARLAGVSKKTVSNYFNGYPYFKPETRARIEAAIAQLNYRVNRAARSLKSGKSGRIGLAIPELAQPYFAELAQSVVSAAQHRGLDVLVEVTGGQDAHERRALHGAATRDVDGMIFSPLALPTAYIDAVDVGIPMVLVGDLGSSNHFDMVTVDSEQGIYDATAHLIASGRSRIVGLGWEVGAAVTAASTRTRGFVRALADHRLEALAEFQVAGPEWNSTGGEQAITQLIAQGVGFDAVMGFNDALAIGALSALLKAGFSVPDDVAVIGFDNIEESAFFMPALTTVDAGLAWVAHRAVELLCDRIGADGASGHSAVLDVAPYELIIRRSA
ncbi:MAG: LacI family DNA-binding transcriptional regulator [Arachnia sp.]